MSVNTVPKNVKRTKPPQVAAGSEEEAKYLEELRNGFLQVDMNYTDYVGTVKLDDPPKRSPDGLDLLNQFYHRQMLMACFRPLQMGVNVESICQSVATYAGIALISKEFRQNTKTGFQNAIYPYVSRLAERDKNPTGMWHEMQIKILKDQNGGRIPLSPRSAALTEIAFAKQAYEDMRKPGANADEIMADYEKAVGNIHMLAERDGLDLEHVRKTKATIIGQMLEQDPSFGKYFSGIAYGRVKRSDFHREVQEDKSVKMVWSGEFEYSADGNSYAGDFSPRRPGSVYDYIDLIRDVHDSSWTGMRDPRKVRETMQSDDVLAKYSHYEDLMREDGFSDVDVASVFDSARFLDFDSWLKRNPQFMRQAQNWAKSRQADGRPARGYEDVRWAQHVPDPGENTGSGYDEENIIDI